MILIKLILNLLCVQINFNYRFYTQTFAVRGIGFFFDRTQTTSIYFIKLLKYFIIVESRIRETNILDSMPFSFPLSALYFFHFQTFIHILLCSNNWCPLTVSWYSTCLWNCFNYKFVLLRVGATQPRCENGLLTADAMNKADEETI